MQIEVDSGNVGTGFQEKLMIQNQEGERYEHSLIA